MPFDRVVLLFFLIICTLTGETNTVTGSVGLNGLLLFLVPILPDTSSTSLLEITVKVASTISSFIVNT